MQTAVIHPELSASIQRLRDRLVAMLAPIGVDLAKPQDLSRQLKLDKSLTWKLSKVIATDEARTALVHVPGDAAMLLVTKAALRAGSSDQLTSQVDAALQHLRKMIAQHVGDKSTLELVVDALPDENGQRLLASRRLAFRGNSAIWGVQAAVRVNATWIAPSKNQPDMIDTALVGGWLDFRRLRHDAQWVLFRRRAITSQNSVVQEPIDPTAETNGPMLMREFCSPTLPQIDTTIEDNVAVSELGQTDVGNSGAFNCFLGSLTRTIGSRFGDRDNETAAFHANISAPVEVLQFDIFTHRDCAFAMPDRHRVQLVGRIEPNPDTVRPRDLLPIAHEVIPLGQFPPEVDSELVPRYAQLTQRVFDRGGWDARDFVGVRYRVEYPPFPTTAIVSMPLEQR